MQKALHHQRAESKQADASQPYGRMRGLRFVCGSLAGLIVLAGFAPVSFADEEYTATVSYVVYPPGPLPEGLDAVAVIDAGVQSTGPGQDEREQKWSQIAADMLEAMLVNGQSFGWPLSVANRRHTQQVLAERDLKLAGLVQGEVASQAGKLLNVQGLITSRITINVDIQRGRSSTIDWGAMLGGVISTMTDEQRVSSPPPRKVYRRPVYRRDSRDSYRVRRGDDRRPLTRSERAQRYREARRRHAQRQREERRPRPVRRTRRQETKAVTGGLTFSTKEVEEISRHLSVQCAFALVDAVTGQTIINYTPPTYQKTDEASPNFLFGQSMDETDLDPVDHFIGELVERATQEFASRLVPVQVEVQLPVEGKHSESERAVRAMRADDYDTAVEWFKKELAEEPDEHEAAFALGVTYELMGDPEQALAWYRKAIAMEDVDEEEMVVYMAAKNRLSDHLTRLQPPLTRLQPPAGAKPATSPSAASPPQ